ncbi:MAG: GGDEF domain-containing protein [Rhodospirillaceae bacterium]|nr:GGDEF domain-containing protein [Rhodospirillaceae bacterium]MBT5192685.1 GGDEF domain-containing protein [Rhodospirillaceae bacterium]MBT5899026.1 GGDEF domain-containing protein [Rhodospirillaceae bacterium]MBT6427521.1 GGDEF domain-containing protein [Rhodospirillaceae bacterium]MBT7761057.1 GGDEF domain-containing protein [Rhodospirillaceae bacterium]
MVQQVPGNENSEEFDPSGHVIAASEEIVESVGQIEDVLQSANVDAAAYSDALSAFSDKILADGGKEAQALIAQMVRQTQEMQEQNNLLRSQLAQSSGKIEELRGNLEKVQHEATTDALTGIGNRKFFDIKLREMTEKSEREGGAVALLMFDVDHFKAFNDNHGHLVGDHVLRLVASTLKDSVKGRDVVARYGGEEFAIILSGADLRNAFKVADDIRKSVAQRRIIRKSSGEVFAKVTISAGVALYRPGEALDDLIERSDAALYRAKDAGRNQVLPEAELDAIAVNQ